MEVTRSQSSSRRGDAARWVISAWTTGGDIPDSTIRLAATPASESPKFSFGCGSNDGTASCDLGAMDAKSAKRQLQAQLTVPATASTVKSVVLKVTGSAAHLPKDPTAAATVTITAAAKTATTPTPTPTPTPSPETTTTTLPVTDLPGIPTADPTLSPGGNAAGLFPTLQPSQDPSQGQKTTSARSVANTSALPEGAPVVGGQRVGLSAQALAFVLAVTRLSVRRRPAPAQPPALGPATPGPATAELAAAELAAAELAAAAKTEKPETEKPETEEAEPEADQAQPPDDPSAEILDGP